MIHSRSIACDGCHQHDPVLVVLSIIIAIFASYIALDLARNLALARGRLRWLWLSGGSLALGIGIWSMHFVAMLAFSVPGLLIAYDIPLMLLSILVAVIASALALYIVSKEKISIIAYIFGSLSMGAAIAGMHYIGIASMKMGAVIEWEMKLVIASILIAVASSFVALMLAFKLRADPSRRGLYYRLGSAVLMGFAISGMHYTAMAAMSVVPREDISIQSNQVLATDGLALSVIVATALIFIIALIGSVVNKALAKRIKLNETLKAAIQSRDEFFSMASHELKTPLTSIKLQTQLAIKILEGMPEHGDQKVFRMLKQTDKSLSRLERLVDDMLDISRIVSGKLSLHVEEFSLTELVKETVDRLSSLFAEANYQVNVRIEGEVFGRWDRFRIEQVLTNLLTNAVKYGAGKPIEVSLAQSEGQAVIKVKDQGLGISSADQQKIFERFERVSGHENITGLGIGLFIVKEIVQMHQGKVQVDSKEGEGSTFCVKLPLTSSP